VAGQDAPPPPPAVGVRLAWTALPAELRAAVEDWLGETVATATNQEGGFSPGVAARLTTASGRRVFLKAVGAEPNPDSPHIHRREIAIAAALPSSAPAPPLLWSYDRDGWVALLFEDIAGTQPQQPWRADELARVLGALNDLAAALTPSPVPTTIAVRARDSGLINAAWWSRFRRYPQPEPDPWSARYLDALIALEALAPAAVDGETLQHLDVRADNLLLTPDRVYVVDWPHAQTGAPWLDLVGMAPSVAMQGGPEPEALLLDQPVLRDADPSAIDAFIALLAGYFTWSALQPSPPGLPTLRPFQDAQGAVARRWLARRRGWH
jgi:aminoglycoside phosphotransferase (APT) family kinase protein